MINNSFILIKNNGRKETSLAATMITFSQFFSLFHPWNNRSKLHQPSVFFLSPWGVRRAPFSELCQSIKLRLLHPFNVFLIFFAGPELMHGFSSHSPEPLRIRPELLPFYVRSGTQRISQRERFYRQLYSVLYSWTI